MSNKVFGVVHHSITHIYDLLESYVEKYDLSKKDISLVENHNKYLPRCPILIFTSFSVFKKFQTTLDGKKVIAFVVDTLPQLYGIDDLVILDCEPVSNQLSYKYKPQKIDVSLVRSAVKKVSEEKVSPLKVSTQELDFIGPLIKTVKEGMILDKINNLIYRTPDVQKRDFMKKEIMNYLVGKTKLKLMESNLSKLFKRGLALTYLKELVAFLQSPKGEKFSKALNRIANHKAKSPLKLDKLSKELDIDLFEVRYLSRLFKSLNNQKEAQLGKLHELTSVIQVKRSNKGGKRS